METAISATTLRIIIAAVGVVILVAIYFFGRPRRPGHGRRVAPRGGIDQRVDPVIGESPGDSGAGVEGHPAGLPRQGELDVSLMRELDRLGATVASERAAERRPAPAPAGQRPHEFPVDRIVSLFVVARGGEAFQGSDIVVAAEKAGLRFGAMHIFHRLVEGRPEAGPIFSMANMLKPGYFDIDRIGEVVTPGVTFFITLPGPLAALDAWDAMLPAAQRITELLDGELLDEDHNALGRQRVAGLREELRAWDRRHEGSEVGVRPRR